MGLPEFIITIIRGSQAIKNGILADKGYQLNLKKHLRDISRWKPFGKMIIDFEITMDKCPICGSKTTSYANPYLTDIARICNKDHCGPESWCKILRTATNMITEIRLPVHKTAVLLKHFHNTHYTFVYNESDRKLLLYFPRLMYNDFAELTKTQQKISTYLCFSWKN